MKHAPSRRPFRRTVSAMAAISLLAQPIGPVYAVSPSYSGFVSQLPNVYNAPPNVNVMFTLDDSGSMQSDAIPDYSLSSVSYAGVPSNNDSAFFNSSRGVSYPNMWGPGSSYRSVARYQSSNAIARYMRSSAGNPLYYNPKVTYRPWPSAANDKVRMANADPAAVKIDYSDPTTSVTTLNLTVQVGSGSTETTRYWPATYYVYTGSTPLPLATPNTPLNVAGSFTKYEIQGSGSATFPRAASRSDCSGTVGPNGCSRTEELKNFANWLQYYRNRRLMAKGGVGEAFSRQGTNLRTGFARLNASPVVRRGMRDFSGANRIDFYNKLYFDPSDDGLTPLRQAVDQVGKHFQTTNVNNPWAEFPGTSIGTEYSCRRSFHMLSTDGFWNSNGATSPASGENDSFSGSTPAKPDGTTYSYGDSIAPSTTDPLVGRFTVNPFKASQTNTLSDVAAYYWKTDLRGLANNVVPTSRDPAFWQHLSTYTIGLGIYGSGTVTKTAGGTADLSTQASRDLLVTNKTALNWPTVVADEQTTGDDLIHASMSGRGRYFSANDPTELATGLAAALSEVADQPLDQASVAADSPQLVVGGKMYQATFSPAKWSGRLYAFTQNATTGQVNNKPTDSGYTNPTQLWEASNKMPAPADRKIFSYRTDGTPTGILFEWSALSSTQQAALNNDTSLLQYLRGSAANEVANGGTFRDRSRYTVGAVTGGVLGDVVNGSPLKGTDYGGGYNELPGGTPTEQAIRNAYTTFRTGTTLDNMRNTIFLGANDGMLHAFNINDGVERFAFVPNAVYTVPRSTSGGLAENKLALLADPAYTHRFTVDGPPNIGDAYIGGSWKSILVSSNGAGARSIFALDVTDPSVGSSGFDTNKIMWEFTHADMGFVISYPHVVRMRNGKFAALFGNGYDSTNGVAKLFIVDLQDGTVIKEFAVDTGSAGNNGLSQPNFTVNANREVTAIYAGDLKGNLWKFDVDSPSPTSWNVAFSNTPLFSAIGPAGAAQPISVMPEITAHPDGGVLLSFGTGKFFESSDTSTSLTANVNLSTQSIYGIWDKPLQTTGVTVNITTRGTLLQAQTLPSITSPTVFGTTSPNVPTWASQRGWYIDLGTGGERVNLSPQQIRSVLTVVANTPLVDPCANGGVAKVLLLDPVTGARPSFPVIDVTGDGTVDSADNGFNVMVTRAGVLTQPFFQISSTTTAPTSGLATIDFFYRGQTSGGRAGGVEATRSFGGDKSINPDCKVLLTAATSDTSLLQSALKTCDNTTTPPPIVKPRISWKQLK